MEAFLRAAYNQAKKSFDEGGIPIGACLVHNRKIIGMGRNLRVQTGDPTAHAEMVALKDAGRLTWKTYLDCTMYTTLAPCSMCVGAIQLYNIPQVIIGETINYQGDIDTLIEKYTSVEIREDPECIKLLRRYIKKNLKTWKEDVGE